MMGMHANKQWLHQAVTESHIGQIFWNQAAKQKQKRSADNLLAVANSSTIGERAIWLAVTSGGLLMWLYFCRRIQIKSFKTHLNHVFQLASPHHPLEVQMPWFQCRALVYNKMIIDSFICSLFKALLCSAGWFCSFWNKYANRAAAYYCCLLYN